MKETRETFTPLILSLTLVAAMGLALQACACEGDDGDEGFSRFLPARVDFRPADDPQYGEECGACRSRTGRAPNVARSLGVDAPLRFTETRYFPRKHDEIPRRLVVNSPDIGSFSRCEACHTGAERGNYDEHQVRIPGRGRWDD